jgi:hypothetical protein
VGAPFPGSHPVKEPTVGSPARPWSFPRAAREEGEEICTCRRPATTRSRGGRRRPAHSRVRTRPSRGGGARPPRPWGRRRSARCAPMGGGGEPLAAAPLGVGDRRRSNPWPHPWGSTHPSGGHAHGGRRTRSAVAAWAPTRSPWPHPWDLGRGAVALCERGRRAGSGGSGWEREVGTRGGCG